MQQAIAGDAIELLDAVQPLDNMSLKRREELAISAAISTGNARAGPARGRAALRPEARYRDADPTLGPDASARPARAGRSLAGPRPPPGRRTEQRAGRADDRSTSGRASSISRADRDADPALDRATRIAAASRSALDPETARPAAMRVLAASGRLPQLIERGDEQLKKTPNSIALHQTLADYYTAARQTDRARTEMARLAELRPEDAELRLRLALQLVEGGDSSAGLRHYKAVFEKDPVLAANSIYEMTNLFERAGKAGELIDLLNGVDVKALAISASTYIVRLIENAPADPKSREAVKALFRKSWAAFPGERPILVGRVAREDIWRMPEMFEYACEGTLPGSARSSIAMYLAYAWQIPLALNVPVTVKNEPTPAVLRLLDLAEERGSLEVLLERINAAAKRSPQWLAAGPLQAMAFCRAGRFDEARAVVPRAIELLKKDEAIDEIGIYRVFVYWMLGRELEKYAATRDLALAAYAACCDDPHAYVQFRFLNATDHIPVHDLVQLARNAGRTEEARHTLLAFARGSWNPAGYAEETARVVQTIGLNVIGAALVELGFAADAVLVLREAESVAERVDPALVSSLFPGMTEVPRQIGERLNAAIAAMSESELTALAPRSIAEAAQAPAVANPGTAAMRPAGGRAGQAIDLMTIVHPRSLDRASVRSLVADSLEACSATELAGLLHPLEALRQAHADDLSIAICLALQALASHDAGRVHAALEQLAALVEKTPLEPLAGGARANARERAAAATQIPLWLVARECRRQANASTVLAIADRLAARALEAARRQDDRVWLLAMLREQGQTAFDRSDRTDAARVWSRMLELVVAPTAATPRRPAGGVQAGGAVPAARAKRAVPEGP